MHQLSHLQICQLDRLAEDVHALGSRAVAGLLIELAKSTDCLARLLELLTAYAVVTPEMMTAAHADRAPSHPLRAMP